MTQPPYVPPRDDEGSTSSDPSWPAAQSTPAYDYGSTQPTYGGSGGERYDESGSSASTGGYTSGGQSTANVANLAKDQAGAVKDTAAQQGQQVAGVAKEQAGAVKDTAVQQGQQVAGVAKEQAGAVKDTAVQQGQQVAEVAKEQATKVASQAGNTAKDLVNNGLSEVRQAAAAQQRRLAGGVNSLATELGTMASKSDNAGPLTHYAQQASYKAGELSHWLESAEPSEVLDMLRSYARRRPGAFLGASALAGVLVGRLSRGFAGNAKDGSTSGSSFSADRGTSGYTTSGYDQAPGYDTSGYQSGTSTGSGYAAGSDFGTGYSTSAQQAGDATTGYGSTGSGGVTR